MDQDERLNLIFQALADTTRRQILARIAEEECRVTDLAKPFAMSLNGVSKHLKILERAGLLTRTKDGRVHRCKMDGEPLEEIAEVIKFYQRFWEKAFDGLQSELSKMKFDQGKD